MKKDEIVINQELLIWCSVVVIELFVLGWLVQSGLVLLLGLVLIPPVKASFEWPMSIDTIEYKSEEDTEVTAKAE